MSFALRAPECSRLRLVRVLPVLDFGGVESRVVLQASLVDRSRYDLRVCAFHKLGAAARAIQASGIRVDALHVAPRPRNLRATLRLTRYFADTRPDIVHASVAEANLHSVVAARLARVPVVIAEEVGSPAHSKLARLVFRGIYGVADAAVGVTRATCEYMTRIDRAPPNRVHCIYNCAGPDFFPERRVRPSEPAPPDKPLRILVVGRLVPVKNHLTFLEAVARTVSEFEVRVRIVGEGPLRDETHAAVQRLGLSRHVELLGFRPEILDLLRESDLFVLPSLSEGCSISLVEAMAIGVPVLASRVPGVVEVLGDQLARDWTVEPLDVGAWAAGLRRARALQAAEHAKLGAELQSVAYERFSPRVYMQNLQRLYTELWQTKQRGRAH